MASQKSQGSRLVAQWGVGYNRAMAELIGGPDKGGIHRTTIVQSWLCHFTQQPQSILWKLQIWLRRCS